MFASKIAMDKGLIERAQKISQAAGYASVEEFIAHIVEKELAKLEDAEGEDEIKKRLQGLGYLS